MEYSTVLLASAVVTLLFDLPAQNVKEMLWPKVKGKCTFVHHSTHDNYGVHVHTQIQWIYFLHTLV